MRRRMYEIIEVGRQDDDISRLYDMFMIVVIVISIVPLCTHIDNGYMQWVNRITTGIFVLDYLMRLFTADFKLENSPRPFIRYPFTGLAIVDLISILPSITALVSEFRLFRMVRLIWTLRTLRIFLLFRYSRNVQLVARVIRRERDSLLAVCTVAVAYVFLAAVVIFNAEPETFPTMFDAIYWSITTLTTVGYGDLYPVSRVGKVITMLSSVLGVAVLAMPTGIITSGFLVELRNDQADTAGKQDE